MNKARVDSGNAVPSSLAQAGIIMKYTLLDYVKSRRFFILLAIVSGISAILTLVVGYSRYPIYDLWGSFAPAIAMFSGIFFGGDAISGEFQNKTGYFIIPNPIRRSSIYIGKWLSAFIASLIILGVFTMVTIGNGLLFFSTVPSEFGLSVLFTVFYLAALLGFVFFPQFTFQKQYKFRFCDFHVTSCHVHCHREYVRTIQY